MDIIMNYIDSMFSGIPVTEQTKRLREDITANMSDKFDELVKEGKSSNEAIGTVISEFGNIDEVLNEMGVSRIPPVSLQTDDPAAKHKNRIRSFGILAGLGAGFTALGISWVSEFGVRGYSYSVGVGGFGILMIGMMLLIFSVLVRTKIFANGGSVPQTVIPMLRVKHEKNILRDYFLIMIFDGIKLASFGIFLISDPWYQSSLNGVLFMSVAVASAFGAEVYVKVTDRTYRQILGETCEKRNVQYYVRTATVPFFAGVLVYIKFDMQIGSHSGSDPAILLIALYMTLCVGAEMFDLAKRKTEQSAGQKSVTEETAK